MHALGKRRSFSSFRGGGSIIELVIALFLIGISIYFCAWSFNDYLKEAKSIHTSTSISQMENAVRQAVFDIIRNYFNAATAATPACDITSPDLRAQLNQSLPSGITLTVLSQSAAAALVDDTANDLGIGRFNQAMVRCQGSALAVTPVSPSDFSGQTGIYFCLQLSPVSGSLAGSVVDMQPIVGEFFYTTIHVAGFDHPGVPNPVTVPFGQLTCAQLKSCLPPTSPAHGILGELFYTLYWTPRLSSTSTARRRASGVLVRGAG